MNEQDQELIERYLRYVRKRRIIIFILFSLITSAGIILFNFNFDNSFEIKENVIQEEIIENQENEIVTNNISNSISIDTDKSKEENIVETTTEAKPVIQNTEKVVENTQPSESNSSERKEANTSKTKPANKDFLFTDGYNMDNVTQAAQEYLKSSGYSGECVPLKDNEGIYIGMRVIFY